MANPFTLGETLKRIHDMAWGKPWPTKLCIINRREILLNETDHNGGRNESEDMGVDYADEFDNSDIPATETFKCLLNIELLQTAFAIVSTQDLHVIVVLREYEFLRGVLENECKGRYVLVIGHPGTGKTVFILYLLLYRLEKKLPTAVQFSKREYIFFDAGGASLCRTDQNDSEPLPNGCWCLCDGNIDTKYPCHDFMQTGLRTFLVTSPSPERYKKWRNQSCPTPVITALPRTVEVAAIAKVHGFRPCDAVSVLQRWGPCIRTVFSILGDQRKDAIREWCAMAAVRGIRRDPSMASCTTNASTILFIIPIRREGISGYFHSRLVIPTPHLATIFEEECQSLSLEGMMTLYQLCSIHPPLRGPGNWPHEKNMHLTIATTSNNFRIFNSNHGAMYMRSAAIRIGTLGTLRTTGMSDGQWLYWIPIVADFPGVDGVLINGNRLFALQATIASTHDGPHEGLRNIWKTIGPEAAHRFIWHFVIITDDESLAIRYARDLGTELRGFTLGRSPPVKVSVWVYVLKRGDSSLGNTGSVSCMVY